MKQFDNFNYFLKLRQKYLDSLKKSNWSITTNFPSPYLMADIVIEYVNPFGIDFIKSKADEIADEDKRKTIKFYTDNIEAYLEEVDDDFTTRLSDFAKYARCQQSDLEQLFKPYGPFLTDANYFAFAFDNLDSPDINLFFIMLMLWMDDEYPYNPRYPANFRECEKPDKCHLSQKCRSENVCLLKRTLRSDNYSFEEEMLDFQRDLMQRFLSMASPEQKSKALSVLLKAFEQVNKTNHYPDKLYTTMASLYNAKEMPMTGTVYISWDKVSFFNGMYHVYHPRNPRNEINNFFTVKDPNSRQIFNEINTIFMKRLLPICAEAKDGKIIKILNQADLASCISTMEYHVSAPPEDIARKKRKRIEKRVLTIPEARELCQQFKSRFLEYLCDKQLEAYRVICCVENKINASGSVSTEYSFIFTVKSAGNKLYLAFENEKNARCTYIFPIRENMWQEAIDKLYEFFASDEVNKRQSLSQRLIDLRLPGNYDYKRVLHTDYLTWAEKIKYCYWL